MRHNVDTAQPYTVSSSTSTRTVLGGDLRGGVDVTASLVMSMSVGKAPVQLRTDGVVWAVPPTATPRLSSTT